MSKEFVCKGCGEKFNKDMQSSNVDYCYICNEFYMKKYVADLEAKLAEKQSKIQELNDMYEDLLVAKGTENELMQVSADCDFFAKENIKLKQQLAEKEKEIEFVKHEREANGASYISACKMLTKERKDKISFCIEQLDKVKEFVKETSGIVGHEWRIDRFRVLDTIDNQIDELKKEMK